MDLDTLADVRRVIDRITYKRGWKLCVSNTSGYQTVAVVWKFSAPDYTAGGGDDTVRPWEGRRWHLSLVGLTEDALVKTALAAALQAEEHECREAFTYNGVRLFDPHISVPNLMEAACRST